MISHSTSQKPARLHILFILGNGLVSLGLLIWSLLAYQPLPIIYGTRAIYSIMLLSIAIAMLGRILLLRLLKTENSQSMENDSQQSTTWRLLLFFDIAAPLYLTAGVLLKPPAAVLTALVTQICVQGYTLWRGLISWSEASYRVATTALLMLLSMGIFQATVNFFYAANNLPPGPRYNLPPGARYPDSWELIAIVCASLVMLFLLIAIALPMISCNGQIDLRKAWRTYLHSSVPRFQTLILSVGTLLPVVDIFDNTIAELSWIFFLVPLLAIYYLALISTRLSIRTDELQRTLEDLSSSRRRQDELRSYASLVTRVQEEERRRLARELHDDTAQALIALSRGLDGLGHAVEKLTLPPKDRDWLTNLQQLADHTLDGVRRACRDLRPSILDDLGLRAALEWLCDSSNQRGVASSFTCNGEELPLPPEAEIAIFRIAQEALSNVWRHAQATHVVVNLTYLPEKLLIHIHDDGCGFATKPMQDHPHEASGSLGLLGMRERAMLIGANLTIHSQPEHGCRVCLTLPISQA